MDSGGDRMPGRPKFQIFSSLVSLAIKKKLVLLEKDTQEFVWFSLLYSTMKIKHTYYCSLVNIKLEKKYKSSSPSDLF